MSAPPSSFSHARTRPVIVRLIDLLNEIRPEQPEPEPEPAPVIERDPPLSHEQVTAIIGGLIRPLLEVLEGRRPINQVRALFEPRVLHRLELTLSPGARRRNSDLRLHKVRACQPDSGVIEASVVVQAGQRFRAIALRLERDEPRWICTALQLG